ncbi:reelin domain-containing protein 1 isoform X2 [Meleagris gallopavo]|uniref:reelin domain-containing protein 1 isoform X2 n=1 Tax=Meleagris gallopavo TaxID=9103 RepID=UPI000549D29D|nr:reelin domain-containing protein 1 isoform X2 [Meleagris gallopavo]
MEERQKACLAVAACACTVLCMVSSTSAFSHGASPSACADMMPRHLRAQLHSPTNNYVTIHTNVSFYVPGDKVPVTVRSSRDFMGFLLQARKVSNDETAGTFVFIPPGSKLLSCFEDGDTVTHSDKSLKRNLSFVWKAPDQPIGDIRFFISVVQSYFVYWARIESATVAQRGHNDTSAGGSRKAGPAAPAPTQEPAGPHVAGTASKAAGEISDGHEELPDEKAQMGILGSGSSAAIPSSLQYPSPALVSPTSITPTPAQGSGTGVHSDMQPTAEPTQLSQALWGASSRSGGSSPTSSSRLEPSLAFQEPGMADALQSFLFQDYASRQSLSDRAQSSASTTNPHLCVTCKEDEQASTENGAALETSLPAAASWSALHARAHLSEAAVTTAWFGNGDTVSNLSLAWRQMAESEPPLRPEEGEEEEEEVSEDVGGHTLPWVTRAGPKPAVPGRGDDSRRGTRLIAAQLGILLVCTAVLGLAAAAGLRYICARYCHKRTEVSFSQPGNNVIAVKESGEMMHFRKIRENSFVLVQAEYNWIGPSSSGKRRIM